MSFSLWLKLKGKMRKQFTEAASVCWSVTKTLRVFVLEYPVKPGVLLRETPRLVPRETLEVPKGAKNSDNSRQPKGCKSQGSKWESNRLRPDRINIMESLILAQNERWRRVLSMQVERQPDHLIS